MNNNNNFESVKNNFDINNKIIDTFDKLRSLYYFLHDKHRAQAYLQAINVIKSYDRPIKSGADLYEYKGIGRGTVERIDKIIAGIDIYGEVLSTMDADKIKEITIYSELSQVYGFGPASIKKLIKKGITSIEQLQRSITVDNLDLKFTHAQLVGIRYYESLRKKIPRSVIDLFKNKLTEMIASDAKLSTKSLGLQWEIVGSYRRLKRESGDIDVLIGVKSEKSVSLTMKKIVSLLNDSGLLIETLTPKYDTKFMGVIKLQSDFYEPVIAHVDLRVVTVKNYPFALCYFTGSKIFNLVMRRLCKAKSLKLNEYSLIDLKTNRNINVKSEEDIFKKIGIAYVAPENR